MKPLANSIRQRFVSLAIALSPENLTCDGELPSHIVRQKEDLLKKSWAILEEVAGRKVTIDEIWGS